MSILIDIEMPTDCLDCPCADEDWMRCQVAKRDFGFFEDTRPDWCPLIPIPEHGRLGDLDELVEKFKTELTISPPQKIGNSTHITLCCAIGFDGVERIINIAPTIIPASEE